MHRTFAFKSLVTSLAAIAACSTPNHHRATEQLPPLRVSEAIVHEEPIAAVYTASGTVRGLSTTVVTSKTTGYVGKVAVRAGDIVTAGQLLAQLETKDVQATVARARAALEHAHASKLEAESSLEAVRANANVAKLVFDRESSLFRSEAISQQQFDEAEAKYRSTSAQQLMAQARVRAGDSGIAEAKAAVLEAQALIEYSRIVAPFSGRVIERHIDPGALAAPGVPLFVVADEEEQRVEVSVEATRADRVREGDSVNVEVDTVPRQLPGKIAEIVPNVDVASRAFIVKVDLPKEAGPLRPGTFARVGFHMGVERRLVVPKSAVTQFGAVTRVFVRNDSLVRLRMVSVGENYGNWTEVLSGLAADERVVVAPPANLRDGSAVEVQL